MPRELELFGMLVPALLPIFVGTLPVWWLMDTLLGRYGAYRLVWHPPLVRLCLFVCLFATASWALVFHGTYG